MVSVSSLVQVYDSESGPVEALRGVSLDIIPGTLTAISGPVGAGKSTLLSLLSGQMLPTDGTVLVCSGNLEAAPLQQSPVRLGYPALSLLPHLNVEDNVTLGCAIWGVEVEEGYLDAVLDAFNLTELLERFPVGLTPQQQQRIALARSFLAHPDLVVADEPELPLDHAAGLRLLSLLGDAARTLGQTVIVATQSPVVAGIADRWILLKQGSVTADVLSPAPRPSSTKEHLPDSLDDIAPPPRLSEHQEQLVNEARRILEHLPGPIQHEEGPETPRSSQR